MQEGVLKHRRIGARYHPETNILLVEHESESAEMVLRAFESQTHCRLLTIPTLAQARTLLEISRPDLIITDVALPDGKGTDLLDLVPDCPTIVMTDHLEEAAGVEAMKSGASEYVVKTEAGIAALPVAASRAMREWRQLIEHRIADDQQQRFGAILEATPDLICIANLDGFLNYINQAGRRLLGIDEGEAIGKLRLLDFHTPLEAKKLFEEAIPEALKNGTWNGEVSFRGRNGESILTSLVLLSHRSSGGENEYVSLIARDIRYLREAEERLEFLAYYDTLTGLPNRNELAKRLEMEAARVKRSGNQGAVMLIDLDNFKTINDSLGHTVGDHLLQEISRRLLSLVRVDDTVARLGGDEFIVILSALSQDEREALSQAREIGNKIRNAIALEFGIGGHDLHTTASIGIAMITRDQCGGDDLLRYADTALYQAKREGRNRLEFFTESMSSDVTRQLALENQLRRALREQQFELHYQPMVDSEGAVVGAEALIRWRHPERGLLPPGEFLDVLEASGQIIEVGNWVLESAFAQLTLWQERGLWQPDFMLSINISPRQFRDPQFADLVQAQMQRVRISPQNVVLEVTEHNIIQNLDDAIARMQDLIQVGIRFSLDDFGTGYSSLSHLKNLPVSHIKIDRSFVQDICENPEDQAMVASILALSSHLRLKVVAEGVEQEKHFKFLRAHHCDFFQGYHFSKPLNSDAMEALLHQGHLDL